MSELQRLAMDQSNWVPMSEIENHISYMNYQQVKRLFQNAKDDKALSKCCRKIGKRKIINLPMLGLWMAGELSSEPVGAML